MADDDLNPHEWEKPAWATGGTKLKSTGKGDAIKSGASLASEITHVNKNKDASRDTNAAANSGILHSGAASGEKDVAWEKPAWTQDAGLNKTGKADKMKGSGNLARPITFPKGK